MLQSSVGATELPNEPRSRVGRLLVWVGIWGGNVVLAHSLLLLMLSLGLSRRQSFAPWAGHHLSTQEWALLAMGSLLTFTVWRGRQDEKGRFKPPSQSQERAHWAMKSPWTGALAFTGIIALVLGLRVFLVLLFNAQAWHRLHLQPSTMLLALSGIYLGTLSNLWLLKCLPAIQPLATDPLLMEAPPAAAGLAASFLGRATRPRYHLSFRRPSPQVLVFETPLWARGCLFSIVLMFLGLALLSVYLLMPWVPRYGTSPLVWIVSVLLWGSMGTYMLGLSGRCPLQFDLEARSYSLIAYLPAQSSSPRRKNVWYVPFHRHQMSGSMDEDIVGLGILETNRKGSTLYTLQVVWKEGRLATSNLGSCSNVAGAQTMLLEASTLLGLTVLGRCP